MTRGPRYPLYIVSKGRADSRITHRALLAMRVPHYIVVEPAEVDLYRAACDPLATGEGAPS